MNSSKSPDFPFFNTTTTLLANANLATIGIPWDVSSSYRRGAAKGPAIIRQATSGRLYNSYTETNVNLRDKWQVFDAGDVEFSTTDPLEARNAVLAAVKDIYRNGPNNRFLFLGGDHLATYFSLYALQNAGVLNGAKNFAIIYLDAHPDLYASYKEDLYSHACILRRILDDTEIDPRKIVQVGIRAATPEQLEFIQQTGITSISRKAFHEMGPRGASKQAQQVLKGTDLIHISIDLDVLDPAFAPGVGNPEPGGLMTSEVVSFIHGLAGLPIFAFDIVEFCPAYDLSMTTAFTAAKLIKEILGIAEPGNFR
ncbi:MAG: agmatinase [Candidatus Hodarchaeales archaeon]|jgi:agmatinase